MQLLLTLEVDADGAPARVDVRATVDPEHTIGQLRDVLARACRLDRPDLVLHRRRSSRWIPLDERDTVAAADLLTGDLVLLGVPAGGGTADVAGTAGAALCLLVTAGPDAGRVLDLTEGYHAVGTGTEDDLTLSDPTLSRHGDFGVNVSPTGVVTVDPGPERTNPLRINGATAERPTVVVDGDILRVGATSLAIRRPHEVKQHRGDGTGSVPFNRTPQFCEAVPEVAFAPLGDIPVKPKPRRFQALSVLAPLLSGIGMAAVFGSPRYLMFAAMSPVVAVGNLVDGRRSGERDFERATEDLTRRVAERRTEIDRALDRERRIRNRNAPDTLELVERAETGNEKAWNRGRASADFLRLRFGDGTITPAVVVQPERSGDPDLRARTETALACWDELADMPVTVDLAVDTIVGLVGEPGETTALASSLVIQAAVLHSPEDLVITAAVDDASALPGWAKWLPHVRSRSSPLAGPHLATRPDQAEVLLQELARIAEIRSRATSHDFDPRWPRFLLVLDAGIGPDPGTLTRLLDVAEPAGVSVLFLCRSARDVPRQGRAIATLRAPGQRELSHLEFVAPERAERWFEPARLPANVAERAARKLAPLRDVSATNAATAIPTTVTLFDALGVEDATAEWVAGQWLTERGYALPAPIGLADNGPVTLDLVRHGPHGLIGGTSGAGKSELVQSLVANLMALNSPERLNVLFVDYKGGALSGLFEGAPHEVGAVTNLSPLLSQRALVSLRAELDRRMELFAAHDVTDLKGMLEAHPHEAPASLLIVVDEFATLKRELPEFVEGVISIAERGRSLGIHLLLSTQRPSGAIDENIKQNTNLRISLRMLDSGESNDVVGTTDAASIPNHLKGRGFARLGPGELLAFQSAWSAAPLRAETGRPPILVEAFTADDPPLVQTRPAGPAVEQAGPSQLTALLDTIIIAAGRLGLGRGRVPWKEPLPPLLALRPILADPRAPGVGDPAVVTFGMQDDPAGQDQFPASVDLSRGSLVIFGSAASGKTTTLVTLACSAAIRDSEAGGAGLTIFGFDCASRQLGVLNRLPQCLPVANGDDLEATTRYLAVLDEVFDRRRSEMAAAVHDPSVPDPTFSPVLVVIDGFQILADTFERSMVTQIWVDRLMRICTQGREVGIYTVAATPVFTGPSGRLANATSNRLVLNQSDENGYRAFGVRSSLARGLDLAPGQALSLNGDLLQVAAVCDPAGADGELRFDPEAVGRLHLTGAVAPECRAEPLPDTTGAAPAGDRPAGLVELGVADLTLAPVTVDVALDGLVVYGPPRSGRSTALANVAEQLAAGDTDLWGIGSRSSPLRDLPLWARSYFGHQRGLGDFLAELQVESEAFPERRRFLIVDDANLVDEMSLNKVLQEIAGSETVLIGSAPETRTLAMNPLHRAIKAARNQVFLRAEDENGLHAALGRRPQIRPGVEFGPGRALVVIDGLGLTVQLHRSRAGWAAASLDLAGGVGHTAR